ncbi:hypothetical protein GCM10009527_020210 [Actinomadura nitritigenes]
MGGGGRAGRERPSETRPPVERPTDGFGEQDGSAPSRLEQVYDGARAARGTISRGAGKA